MDIINDKLFAKKQNIRMGTRSGVKIDKIEKKNATNKPLAIYDPKKQIKLQINVSNRTIRTMVFQQRKFLDYYSKKLTPAETNYTIGNKKMFAVMVTLKH